MASEADKSNQPGDRDVVLGGSKDHSEQTDISKTVNNNRTDRAELTDNVPDQGAILGGEKPIRRWHLLFQEQPELSRPSGQSGQFDRDRELATWQQERDRTDRSNHQNQHSQQNNQPIQLSHANLRGSYFRQDNLSEAQLNHADLSGANLSEAVLNKADLRGANLSCTNFQGANLRAANLRHSNLQGANLSYADLEKADLHGANLGLVNLEGANIGSANFKEVQNLSAAQIKTAQNWRNGHYDRPLQRELGLDV
ncbi:pentapeptide repeat protein [Thalassoporum mexicanum PCC 7367]|uniref:pentapeptide repeat-containing protein n=1 Tax=Thalassoporum mexicanum TaxID=3457544 RepID=UPI00029FB5B8|nr:pentapeptide repeat-containing protein [Pseudanabaena sp. PCC 7367]AFY70051.1 pentapeptide repeat protein [Pseudanabaena sp. PCC 7367]